MPNKERTLAYSDSAGIIEKGGKKKLEMLINSLSFKEAGFLTKKLKSQQNRDQ